MPNFRGKYIFIIRNGEKDENRGVVIGFILVMKILLMDVMVLVMGGSEVI